MVAGLIDESADSDTAVDATVELAAVSASESGRRRLDTRSPATPTKEDA